MVAKTISLAEDAYEALLAAKRPDESFSDVVRRLTRRRSLTDLCGILPPAAAEALATAVEANGQDRTRRRRKELGLG
ncbi:MAG: antitoxin VapB family protein [Thermoplasmatota archaeon]